VRSRTAWLAALACVLLLALALCLKNRAFEFDDGLIYQRYVRNLLEGQGLVYNPGERFNGLTSPFYTLLTSAVAVIARDAQAGTAVVCSFSMLAYLAVFSLLFARQGAAMGAVAGALIAATHPYLYWTFGVETPLFLLLLGVLLLLLLEQASSLWLGIVLAMLVLTRPEGGLLGVALAVEHVRQRRPLPKPAHFVAPALLLAAMAVFNAWYYGSPLPSTAAAKFGQGLSGYWGSWPAFLKAEYHVAWFFGGRWLLAATFALLAIVGAAAFGRTSLNRVAFVFLALLTVFYFSFNSPNYHWYYAPYYAFAFFYAGVGVERIVRGTASLARERLGSPTAARLLAMLVTALCFTLPVAGAKASWETVARTTNHNYLAIGRWLERNTPSDATVAAAEVGYIGWYSRRRIIDILGLVNPLNAAFVAKRDLHSWLDHYDPDYILVHDPSWKLESGAMAAEGKGRYAPDPRFVRPGYRLLKRSR
jgi:hypothetical protein